MEKELLYRFLKCDTTSEEEERVLDWVEASSGNSRELNRMQLTLEGIALAGIDSEKAFTSPEPMRRFVLRKFLRRSAAAAAAILIAAGIGYGIASKMLVRLTDLATVIEVPLGQRISMTLADGTFVWLNGGTKLEYPSVFPKKQRRVKVSGEAMFDVRHDASRPFIVETFGHEVEVLGTKFNILADAATSRFSAALLEGRLKVSSLAADRESVVLSPDERVESVDGQLRLDRIADHDEFLWIDGLLNLNNLNFIEVMKKFEKYYGFSIVIESDEDKVPQMKYNGKLKVASGVDYAMQALQMTSEFSYVRDDDTNTIYIK